MSLSLALQAGTAALAILFLTLWRISAGQAADLRTEKAVVAADRDVWKTAADKSTESLKTLRRQSQEKQQIYIAGLNAAKAQVKEFDMDAANLLLARPSVPDACAAAEALIDQVVQQENAQ